MTMAERMREKLTQALSPTRLDIIDDSHRHAGHAGAREGGETHFTVEIVSGIFAGKSRVERQRLVYSALAAELQERVHALALRTLTPAEDAGQGTPSTNR
jgi:BolA protein